MAEGKGAAGAAILHWFLRRAIFDAFPVCARRANHGGRPETGNRRVRKSSLWTTTRRGVGRPDAIQGIERHGLPLRLLVPLRKGIRIQTLQSGNGAACERRPVSRRLSPGAPRQSALPTRRILVQLPGAPAIQGEV